MPELFFILNKIFPPNNPYLTIKRLKNFLFSYINWKFGLSIKTSPVILQIEPVKGCNLNCVMCRAGEFKKEFMKFEDFKKIIDEIPEVLVIILNLAGEPFLSRDTIKMIKYASSKRNIIVNIFSNFTVLPEADEIIDSGLYEIHASIDSFNPEKFKKIRENGDLDKVVRNLENLVRRKKERKAKFPIISINSVFAKETAEDAEDIIKNGIKIGVDRIKFQKILYSIPELTTPDMRDFEYLIGLKKKYENKIKIVINNFEWGGDYVKGYCYLLYFSSTVDVKGNVFPCCMPYPMFEPHKSIMGNINQEGKKFVEKRQGIMKNFRKGPPSFCKNCPIYFRN